MTINKEGKRDERKKHVKSEWGEILKVLTLRIFFVVHKETYKMIKQLLIYLQNLINLQFLKFKIFFLHHDIFLNF